MKILLTGATGFIGKHLVRRLLIDGHEVAALSRDPVRASRRLPRPVALFGWDAASGPPPAEALHGVEAIVHLAGESVADRRWSTAVKRRLVASRIRSTELLMQGVREMPGAKPKAVIASSGVGYYGDRADEVLHEDAAPGTDFLARLCVDWEAALAAGAPAETRTVSLRTGMVLGENGGALPRLIKVFRAGLGGRLASGRQWVSWIHIDDMTGLIVHALNAEGARGALNATAPEPVRNRDLTHELARALKRPALFPAPALALRIALGEFASSIIGGQRALPAAAQRTGFAFQYRGVRDALQPLCAHAAAGLHRFEAEQWLPPPPEEIFPFFTDAGNLEALTPPMLRFRLLGMSTPVIRTGTTIDYRLRVHGLPVRWRTLIESVEPPRRFTDLALKGPYAHWHHEHRFDPAAGGTLARDIVRYRFPLGPLGALVAGRMVRRDLRQIFAYRRRQLAAQFGGGLGDAEEWMVDA
jgi:hypothetical protein